MCKIASIIAEVFSPFILCGLLVSLIAVRTDPSPLVAILCSLGSLVLIPQLLSIQLHRAGKTTDRFVRVRAQRTQLYVMTLASVIVGCLLLNIFPTSRDVQTVMNTAAVTLVVAMVLNFRIKISIHALMAALFGLVAPVYLGASPLYFALGAAVWAVTVWARWQNKRHTLPELALGTLLGAAVALVYLQLVGF